ncbi:SH3 domain-containing protein [Corallococcus exiguus]|uniref:SH3 domain-containing protein n=1 Tax=Corallococcus exiguus TaxID=83462 RepID=A0A7X4YDQ4_9BACT|nr:SH3 domain-containing protein [Corallococcus exiguus]NBC42844.1 SH3 domain-containing protein [Corallococcus exiguus]TNV66537.1 SH3 domain-containing protein [Corallococcus exiguus]
MFSDGIRRTLGPLLRTVANTTVEKVVAPPLQPAAKAVTNFAVSSFERGTSQPVVLNPPVIRQATPTVVTPPSPPNVQGDGNLGAGDWLNVTQGVNQRQGPGTEFAKNTTFGVGTKLKVIAPPDNGAVRQKDFVYVENSKGQKGWVHTDYVGELSADDLSKYQAELSNQRAGNHQTDAADEYQDIYVNQFDAETQVGGDGRNANCGPASTLMAMRNEGLDIPSIPGITHNGTAGADVQAVRYWGNTGSDNGSDGVTTNDAGETVYSLTTENSQYTGFEDVKNVVTAARGSWAKVAANSESIQQAIESGMSVVISGTFVETPKQAPEGTPPALVGPDNVLYLDSNKDGAPDTNNQGQPIIDRMNKGDTWARGGGAREHLVAVVGVTPEGNFIVCDPAVEVRTPIEVTPAELDAFMRGNAGAIGIYDPTPGPRSGA